MTRRTYTAPCYTTLLFCAAALITGCAGSPFGTADPSKTVVATVNGTRITRAQLNQRVNALATGGQVDPNTSLGRRAVLDLLINEELLREEARNSGIYDRPEIQQAIKAQTDQLILNQLIAEKFGQQLTVTDEEAASFYENNKERFVTPEKRHVRHLLVEDEETAKKAQEELAAGADFATLVEEKAIGMGKGNGGDLGYIEKAGIIPEFAETAFSLEKEAYSDPVETSLGCHIIQVLDITEPVQLQLDDVRDLIKRSLLAQKRDALVNNWAQELRAMADVTVRGSMISQSPAYRLETLGVQPE